MIGRKVAPKYRSKKDPKLTWAGRGAIPLWMRDEMKAGKLKGIFHCLDVISTTLARCAAVWRWLVDDEASVCCPMT
jgi:hypothetical protein